MKGFFKTVALVTVFSLSGKFLGMLYRIFLSYKIGTEGIGLYQVVFSVFSLVLTVCCSGTPVTVSRLMLKYNAENDPKREKKVISAGIFLTLIITLPVVILLFALNGILDFLFADTRCKSLFLILLPSLVFTSIYSVLRGVFWGRKDFLPYSIIELLEEITMIVVGIVLIHGVTDVYLGTKYAIVAISVSLIFSFFLSFTVFFIRKNKIVNPQGELLPLIKASAPVTAMRTASSLITSLVSIILPVRLMCAGYTNAESMSAFGACFGQALPVLFAPSALIGSFTIVLIPELSENFYKKNFSRFKSNVENAVKFSSFITCLCFPVFSICGDEIGMLVFGSDLCGQYLSVSSFMLFFIGLSNMTTSILNSMGKENKTLIFYIISTLLLLASIWFLPKYIGAYSLIVGFALVYCVTALLNVLLLLKSCPEKPRIKRFFLFSVLLQIPVTLFGLMLKKLILSYLGSVLSLLICTVILLPFNSLLFIGFNLISLDELKAYLPKIKLKKRSKAM